MKSLNDLLKKDAQTSSTSQMSMEHLLANSIRRAKQKIYHHQDQNCSLHANSIDYTSKKSLKKVQNISESRYNYDISGSRREDRSAIAIAMKSLQQRISSLQKQKHELEQKLLTNRQTITQKDKNDGGQFLKLVMALREKQQQISKLKQQNLKISSQNAELRRIIIEFQTKESLIESKQSQIMKGKEKIQSLTSKLNESQVLIQKLKHQLQVEKKNNIIQIRLHQQQILKESMQNQSQTRAKSGSIKNIKNKDKNQSVQQTESLKKQIIALKQANDELFKIAQKNKASSLRYQRQSKQNQEKYAILNLLSKQLVEHVRQFPTPSFGLKNLLNKICRVQHEHMRSLKSRSNGSNKMKMSDRSSISISRNRIKPLKMQDLNSSSKKSISYRRSASKSGQKSRLRAITLQQSHSQRKLRFTQKCADQLKHTEIEDLQKEVNKLKKIHRNLIVKTANCDISDKQKQEIDAVINQYNEKREKLDNLKKTQ